jgi:hypothetical protein
MEGFFEGLIRKQKVVRSVVVVVLGIRLPAWSFLSSYSNLEAVTRVSSSMARPLQGFSANSNLIIGGGPRLEYLCQPHPLLHKSAAAG